MIIGHGLHAKNGSVRPLLEVQDVYAGYDGRDVLRGLTLHVNAGEIVCIVGPNGAGKSTVLKAIYGMLGIRHGTVLCNGRDITNISPRESLRVAGITIVPQSRSVFPDMSVRENLELGMVLSKDNARIRQRISYVYELFPQLASQAKRKAGAISGGEQRMLEIGRALMWEPRLVLLDEPSAGLAPIITKSVFSSIRRLNEELGLTVLMIEQNARAGLEASHRGYVMGLGRRTHDGLANELLDNVNVRRAFIGRR